MTTYKSNIIPISSTFKQQLDEPLLSCKLKWRQKQLLVSLNAPNRQLYLPPLPALETEQSLVECLKHSYVKLIRLDPALGEVNLKLWADACEKANKAVFLRLPATIKLEWQRSPLGKLIALLDWIIAALLLLVLSPVIVVLFCLLRLQSSEPIFSGQWHVGERGKLFQILKFRTTVVNTQTFENKLISEPKYILKRGESSQITNLGYWMCKYKLDQLPQLFNVLRGEMMLIKPRPLTLEQVVRLSLEKQHINTLSEIKEADKY